MVKTSPSNAEGAGLIPDQGAKFSHAWWRKNQNIKKRSNVVTSLIKTLKIVHIKENLLKRERERLRVRLRVGQCRSNVDPEKQYHSRGVQGGDGGNVMKEIREENFL